VIIVGGSCSSNLSVKFLLWSVYVSGYSVDYFHKNSERVIGVIIQLLGSAIIT